MMKILLLLAALVAMALGPMARAQDPRPAEGSFQQIRAELLVARLPEAKALALQKELREAKTIQRGVEKLLAMIEKDQAELIDWPSVTTVPGNRAMMENVRELRYPVEYQFPKFIPAKATDPDGTVVATPSAPAGPPGGADNSPETKGPEAGQALASGGEQISGAGPTTFDSRNLGVTLEIDPIILEDGATMDIRVTAKHVGLVGYRRETFEAKGRYEFAVQQPIFDQKINTTRVMLKSGGAQLLGFYVLQEPKKTVELHILTATIVESKYKLPPAAAAKEGEPASR